MSPSPSLGYSGSLAQQLSIKANSSSSIQPVALTGTLAIPSNCSASQHYTGSVCAENTLSCFDFSNGIIAGSKTWGGSSYGSCQASSQLSCFAGYSYSAGTCSLLNSGQLAMEYMPDESLLAIPNQQFFYTNNGGGNFGRLMIKFTLPEKSYINSFDIKFSANTSVMMGFGVFRVQSGATGIDGAYNIAYFDTYINTTSAGLKTVSMNGNGLLLEASDYYIVDMTGYFGGSYKIPLYFSPSNVSASIYGQECTFGYGACPYGGGQYTPFNIPPANYAPYFKIHSTVYVPPQYENDFRPDLSKLVLNPSIYGSYIQPAHPRLTQKIKFSVTQRSVVSQYLTRLIQNDSNSFSFKIYTDDNGSLGAFVAQSSSSSNSGSSSPYDISFNFPDSPILEVGDYWMIDDGSSAFNYPLYLTSGRSSSKLLFNTCDGVNWMFGATCGNNFGGVIYGVDVMPWYQVVLTPYSTWASSASSCQSTVRRSCLEHFNAGCSTSGTYQINPVNASTNPQSSRYQVYCDMDNGGYTLIAAGGKTNCTGGNTIPNKFFVNNHNLNTYGCGYMDETSVRALANLSTSISLQAGLSPNSLDESHNINSLPVDALKTGGSWQPIDMNSAMSAWDWTASCSATVASWPNMYYACGRPAAVHWLGFLPIIGYNYGHSQDGFNYTLFSRTWIK